MKQRILKGAAALVLFATLAGITGVLGGFEAAETARILSLAGILGLGSIGLFFVGLATPTEQALTAHKRVVGGGKR